MRCKFVAISVVMLWISAGCVPEIQKAECPNGDSIFITDLDSLYSAYIPVYEMGLKAYLQNIDGLERKAADDYKKKIVTLRDTVNHEAMQYHDMLKTAFVAMQSQPCDPDAKIMFYELAGKINKRGEDLYKIGIVESDLK